MKKTILILTVIVILGSLTSKVMSQSITSATGSVSATIVIPIAISKTTDMNFGNIAVSAATGGGTVTLPTSGSRTKTGNITLPNVTGSPTAGIFHVTGNGSFTYAITLPGSFNISHGADVMLVHNFVSDPSGTGTLSSGAQDIYVGATLDVAASQPAGLYTNLIDFTISVDYN